MPPRHFVCALLLLVAFSIPPLEPLTYSAPQRPRARQSPARKPAKEKALANADVVRMVKNGFSEDSVITTIQTNTTQFDLSVDALIELKSSGVSERVISVMQSAQGAGRGLRVPSTPPPGEARPTPPPAPPLHLEQPYILAVAGGTRQPLPLEPTHVGKAEAQGNDLGSLAKEQATNKLYNGVELATAARIGMAVDSRLASIPLLGAAVGIGSTMMGGIGKVGRLVHKPKPVTYLWAVPGRSSSMGIHTLMPQFEIVYGEIPGIDPDEYEPFVVRLVQTRENWRLVGATKADPEAFKSSKWDAYSAFVEERIPARSNKIGRGHYLITPEKSLEGGEYGVVLRPVVKSKIFSGDDLTNRKNSGILFDTVWSFSVAP